jgi:hypothetical protein
LTPAFFESEYMTQIVLRTELDASPVEAFEFLTDFDYLSHWRDGVERAHLRGGGDPTVGSIVEEMRLLPALLGGRHELLATLTHVERGRRIAGRVVDRGVQVSFAWQFDQVRRDHTRVTLRLGFVPTSARSGLTSRIAAFVARRQEARGFERMPAALTSWRRAGRSVA